MDDTQAQDVPPSSDPPPPPAVVPPPVPPQAKKVKSPNRVRIPLSSKLLGMIFSILLGVIGFLSVAAILLFQEDKRAYVYQSQETTAQLAGRDFANLAKKTLDAMKLVLASLGTKKEITEDQKKAITTLIQNQTEVGLFSIEWMDFEKGTSEALWEKEHVGLFEPAVHGWENVLLPDQKKEWIRILIPELKKRNFAFFNSSSPEYPMSLGVLLTDTARLNQSQGFVIWAWVNLQSFNVTTGGSRISIATDQGWTLYDSELRRLTALENLKNDPLFQSALGAPSTSGAKEIQLENKHFLGTYVKPGLGLVTLTRIGWHSAMDVTYALTEHVILLGLMSIGLSVILGIFFSKSLTGPLNQLYDATIRVSEGHFDLKIPPSSRDEIGALCRSFSFMSGKIQELLLESMEKVRMEGELAIAARVQATLLPPEQFENPFVELRSHYRSASECGGDWWGFFPVGDKMAFMIADATGHGMPSALITASARSCFSFIQKLAEENTHFPLTPSIMLSYANRIVFDSSSGQIMMTMFAAVFDFKKGELTFANAGHNPPWLFKNISQGKSKVESLMLAGQRVGESRESPIFEEKTVSFSGGDLFFFYTDGLLEGNGDANIAKKTIRKKIEKTAHHALGDLAVELIDDFDVRNAGKSVPVDDVTFVFARTKVLGGHG